MYFKVNNPKINMKPQKKTSKGKAVLSQKEETGVSIKHGF